MNGESTDNTLEIVLEYVQKDSRFRYISEPSHGIYDAFNKGGVFVLELTDGRRITKQVMGSQLDIKTHVRCVSFNPDYPDEELPRSMILRVWRVVHCLTAL